MTAARKISLAILLLVLLSVVRMAGAQQNEQIIVDTSHLANSFSPLRALGGAVDRQRGGITQEAIEKHTTWVLTDPVLKDLLGSRVGDGLVPAKYGVADRGVALEPARHMEQSSEERRLFRRQRGANQPADCAFMGLSAAPPRSDPGGRYRLVSNDRRRPRHILEEQSLPNQGVHRRR